MLSEIDTRAHFGDAHIQATDWTDFHADFWTMNGRAYPDTLEPNGTRDENGQLLRPDLGRRARRRRQRGPRRSTTPSHRVWLFSNPLSSLVQAHRASGS